MAKKGNTNGLERYRKLRAKAKSLGIVVPRGTDLAGLQRLVAGKSTEAQIRDANRSKAQKKAQKKSSKVPSGARSASIRWGW